MIELSLDAIDCLSYTDRDEEWKSQFDLNRSIRPSRKIVNSRNRRRTRERPVDIESPDFRSSKTPHIRGPHSMILALAAKFGSFEQGTCCSFLLMSRDKDLAELGPPQVHQLYHSMPDDKRPSTPPANKDSLLV
jgi:hypothetical protein